MSTALPSLSPADVAEKLAAVPPGVVVSVTCVHRPTSQIRVITGGVQAARSVGKFTVKKNLFPSSVLAVLSIVATNTGTPRGTSVATSAAVEADDSDDIEEIHFGSPIPTGRALEAQVAPTPLQPDRAQPRPESEPQVVITREALLAILGPSFRNALSPQPAAVAHTTSTPAAVTASSLPPPASTQLVAQHLAPPSAVPAPPSAAGAPTFLRDTEHALSIAEALKGHDHQIFRLAGGLLFPKALPAQFEIFSIPHLVFRECPATGVMTRVPLGTALPHYRALIGSFKFLFPNQAVFRSYGKQTREEQRAESVSASVRAQIVRAECDFVDLLRRIDTTETADLPTSKAEWMVFVNAGLSVFDLYATLAFGYSMGAEFTYKECARHLQMSTKLDLSSIWASALEAADRRSRGNVKEEFRK